MQFPAPFTKEFEINIRDRAVRFVLFTILFTVGYLCGFQ